MRPTAPAPRVTPCVEALIHHERATGASVLDVVPWLHGRSPRQEPLLIDKGHQDIHTAYDPREQLLPRESGVGAAFTSEPISHQMSPLAASPSNIQADNALCILSI
ncbi:unnamed protein product [Arctogadus glacialis]